MTHPLTGPALGFAARLKFPTLFKITLALFVINLFVPDLIPFIDEILLGLASLLLANWKQPEAPPAPAGGDRPVIEGEARRE